MGLGLSFRGEPLEAPIRIGSAPPVRCQSAGRSSYSKEVRPGYLNCPFHCSSVAISTDLNCSEPNLVPAGPDCHWNFDSCADWPDLLQRPRRVAGNADLEV